MPLGTWDRLPIPTLTTYSVLSTALFAFLLYNANQVTKDPSWQGREFFIRNESNIVMDDEEHLIDLDSFNLPDSMKNILFYMIQDGLSRWVFINAITCAIILFGKVLQRVIFGDLRILEIINFREKVCNYFLYKCIFMFGIIKVQTAEDVILLLGWFGVLGFLQIFVQFSKDRLEYMITVSSHVTFWSRCKIVSMLLCLFMIANYMIYLCLTYVVNLGYNIFAFMIAEVSNKCAVFLLMLRGIKIVGNNLDKMKCLSITLRVPHILIKYVIDPFEAKFIREHNQRFLSQNSFANFIISKMEMSLTYYVSLGLELADLCLELLHYLHMLLWGNIFFSVASFAICMHVRYLMTEIQRKIKKHRNYIWILNHMEKEYPIASEKELSENSDNCAICWEKMEIARKLPCRHLFHSTCLQLWLEQDTSCPTCRFVLNMNGSNVSRPSVGRQPRRIRVGDRNQAPINRQHFFHFDGSRYVSWLPSFSVQVMSTLGTPEIPSSQLEAMARQVQLVFPHYPVDIIMDNLRTTRSVNVTSNNILEGLLPLPENHLIFEEDAPQIARNNEVTTSFTSVNIAGQSGPSPSMSSPISSSSNNNSIDDSSTSISSSSSVDALDDESNCRRASSTSSMDFNIPENEFSPSPAEREQALRNRKEQLFLNAKKKFLEKRLVN